MTFRSALYVGSVLHHRLRPRVHRLRYRLFWMLLDLDEIDALARGLRLFSRNRLNAMSFYDADHGDGGGAPLRLQVERHLAKAGIADGGRISLFCMPRVFGYGFNPLSIYFCYSKTDALVAILYEVHNTFGERHSYLIPVDDTVNTPVNTSDPVIAQQCRKVFHVSPFMDMDMTYQFRVAAPAERIAVAISAAKADGVQLFAALSGRRRDVSDASLLRLLISHPLLTLKVVGAIHWHALRLLLKGIKLRHHPAPPSATVTAVLSKAASSAP